MNHRFNQRDSMHAFDSGQFLNILSRRDYEKKESQQQILREEREKQILGRFSSMSVIKILQLQNVRSILFCSWFIYLKYQMVNHRMLNIDQINDEYTSSSTNAQSKMDKTMYVFIATVLQTCLSFLIGRFLFGRSMTITYFIIGLTFFLDVVYSLFFYRGR